MAPFLAALDLEKLVKLEHAPFAAKVTLAQVEDGAYIRTMSKWRTLLPSWKIGFMLGKSPRVPKSAECRVLTGFGWYVHSTASPPSLR